MKVVQDRNAKARRGLTRFLIDCSVEHKAGMARRRYERRNDEGRLFDDEASAKAHMFILEERMRMGGTAGDSTKTFADATEKWVAKKKTALLRAQVGKTKVTGEAHMKDTVSSVKNHIIGKWTLRGVPIAQVPLATITHQLLDHELFDKGQINEVRLTRNSVVQLLQRFRQIFDVAVEERWIFHSPATNISLEKEKEDVADKAIDPKVYGRFRDDMPFILEALKIIEPDAVLPIETLLLTGMRGQELEVLSLSQLDVTNRKTKIFIDRAWKTDNFLGKPKSGLARDTVASFDLGVALTARAVELGRRDDDYIFGPDRDERINRRSLLLDFRQAMLAVRGWGFFSSSANGRCKRAYRLVRLPKSINEFTREEWLKFKDGQSGIPKGQKRDGHVFSTIEEAFDFLRMKKFVLHDLRHLYASQLLHHGVPLSRVAQRLGDLETTVQDYYKHYLPDDDDADMEDIAAIAALA